MWPTQTVHRGLQGCVDIRDHHMPIDTSVSIMPDPAGTVPSELASWSHLLYCGQQSLVGRSGHRQYVNAFFPQHWPQSTLFARRPLRMLIGSPVRVVKEVLALTLLLQLRHVITSPSKHDANECFRNLWWMYFTVFSRLRHPLRCRRLYFLRRSSWNRLFASDRIVFQFPNTGSTRPKKAIDTICLLNHSCFSDS